MDQSPFSPLPVTLRQITGFLTAAELLSFTGAAQRLHMTQPAFSQLIREMEAALGVRLFDRSTRKVALTEFGASARLRLGRGVGVIRDVCQEARTVARLEAGHLGIGTLQSTAVGIVTDALGVLKRRAPGLSVSLHEDFNGALLDRLGAGDFEIAVCAKPATPADITFVPLFEESFGAVVPVGHPSDGHLWFDWTTLGWGPVILTAQRSSTREQVGRALDAAGVRVVDSYQVENRFTAIKMVRAGLGITFLPETVLEGVPRDGLTIVPVRDPGIERTIGVAHRRERGMSPAALHFVELLRSIIAERNFGNRLVAKTRLAP
jgi:LysR family carnitine catabolism transcriptional activator